MLSKQMLYNLENSSAIRKMFIEGQELAEKVGAENVFDFSLGNPVAPVPKAKAFCTGCSWGKAAAV